MSSITAPEHIAPCSRFNDGSSLGLTASITTDFFAFLITDSNLSASLASTETLLSIADMLNVAHEKMKKEKKHIKLKNLIFFIYYP